MDQLTQVIRILKTPVTLIALLGLLFGAAYWGYKAVTTEITTAEAKCVMTDVGSELTPKSVQLRTLNAGAKGGQAKVTATFVRSYGFTVIRVGNSDRIVDKTVIVGNSVDDPEVKLTMQFFPNSIAEGDGRADHVVDVLIGTQLATADKPVTTVPVSGPVCLPAPLTPSASASAASAVPSPSASASKKK